jgi:SlyX.
MNPSSTDAETDARLTRLEEKFGYAEDLLDALNALVARQQDQIGQLLREVAQLQRQRAANDQPSAPTQLVGRVAAALLKVSDTRRASPDNSGQVFQLRLP